MMNHHKGLRSAARRRVRLSVFAGLALCAATVMRANEIPEVLLRSDEYQRLIHGEDLLDLVPSANELPVPVMGRRFKRGALMGPDDTLFEAAGVRGVERSLTQIHTFEFPGGDSMMLNCRVFAGFPFRHVYDETSRDIGAYFESSETITLGDEAVVWQGTALGRPSSRVRFRKGLLAFEVTAVGWTAGEGRSLALTAAREWAARLGRARGHAGATMRAPLPTSAPQMASQSVSTATDTPEYIRDLIEAANLGLVGPMERLAALYQDGEEVEQNPEEAAKWMTLAAETGSAKAQRALGTYYDYAFGVEQDHERAVWWYRKAADQGDSEAQNNLAVSYATGEGVAKDLAQARYWFKKAADQGDARAQNNLADLYDSGRGGPEDKKAAARYYLMAAKQGHLEALNSLGVCHLRGDGVARNPEVALAVFLKAAKRDMPVACYNVAGCYASGTGTERNREEALIWYRKAAELGYERATQSIAELEASMATEEGATEEARSAPSNPLVGMWAGSADKDGRQADLVLSLCDDGSFWVTATIDGKLHREQGTWSSSETALTLAKSEEERETMDYNMAGDALFLDFPTLGWTRFKRR